MSAPAEMQRFGPLFEEQRRRYRERPYPLLAERRAKLDRLERAILRHRAAIARALQADLRKAVLETEMTETLVTLGEVRHARRELATWMRPQSVRTPVAVYGSRSEIRCEPRGVVLIMGPFNLPFQLTLVPLALAIAAGNRAVLRVSEKTPRTRDVIADIVAEAFDPGEVAAVGGEIDTAQALLEVPFDHIFFTGSTAVGTRVMAAAARHLASVTLELGGKSPALVCADADVAAAAARIAWGKCLNAGQTCIAPDYALVPVAQEAAFLGAVAANVRKMYGADAAARERSPDLCRLIDDRAFERVCGLIDASLAAGARIAFGGERSRSERYIAPTVLSHVDWEMPIMQEEIFGPVLPVLRYDSLEAVLVKFAERPKPLALYVFTRDPATRDAILRATSAGSTVVNDTLLQWGNHHLPMGGVGASGQGAYHGVHGFRAFSHERAIMHQSRLSPAGLLAPPFGARARILLRLLDRLS